MDNDVAFVKHDETFHLLIIGDIKGHIKLYHYPRCTILCELKQIHRDSIVNCMFIYQDNCFITCDNTGLIIVWHYTRHDDSEMIFKYAFSWYNRYKYKKDQLINDEIMLFNTGYDYSRYNVGYVTAIKYEANNDVIFMADENGILSCWDIREATKTYNESMKVVPPTLKYYKSIHSLKINDIYFIYDTPNRFDDPVTSKELHIMSYSHDGYVKITQIKNETEWNVISTICTDTDFQDPKLNTWNFKQNIDDIKLNENTTLNAMNKKFNWDLYEIKKDNLFYLTQLQDRNKIYHQCINTLTNKDKIKLNKNKSFNPQKKPIKIKENILDETKNNDKQKKRLYKSYSQPSLKRVPLLNTMNGFGEYTMECGRRRIYLNEQESFALINLDNALNDIESNILTNIK
mmetsp:Transcript_87584/g.107348  ORF Transcript_87584/g.107348 Transcript_87584/m.107348 type:complete len:402 (-) Transcript_87584:4-1209(-)